MKNVPDTTDRAILRTIIYYNLLSFPLTLGELWRSLERPEGPAAGPSGAGCVRDLDELKRKVTTGYLATRLAEENGIVCLRGRGQLFADREDRSPVARRYWAKARFFIRLYRFVPFLRMIGVSGSLALGNASRTSDIDLFIVARDGRIHTVRAFSVLVTRLLGSYRDPQHVAGRICLNHFISDRSLEIDHHTLYTARLFAQLSPGYHLAHFREFLQENLWIREILPEYPWINYPSSGVIEDSWWSRLVRATGEFFLSSRMGDLLERQLGRLQERRIAADRRVRDPGAQVVVTPICLRFHLAAQEPVMLHRYRQALSELA